jgi:hypothetical protein
MQDQNGKTISHNIVNCVFEINHFTITTNDSMPQFNVFKLFIQKGFGNFEVIDELGNIAEDIEKGIPGTKNQPEIVIRGIDKLLDGWCDNVVTNSSDDAKTLSPWEINRASEDEIIEKVRIFTKTLTYAPNSENYNYKGAWVAIADGKNIIIKYKHTKLSELENTLGGYFYTNSFVLKNATSGPHILSFENRYFDNKNYYNYDYNMTLFSDLAPQFRHLRCVSDTGKMMLLFDSNGKELTNQNNDEKYFIKKDQYYVVNRETGVSFNFDIINNDDCTVSVSFNSGKSIENSPYGPTKVTGDENEYIVKATNKSNVTSTACVTIKTTDWRYYDNIDLPPIDFTVENQKVFYSDKDKCYYLYIHTAGYQGIYRGRFIKNKNGEFIKWEAYSENTIYKNLNTNGYAVEYSDHDGIFYIIFGGETIIYVNYCFDKNFWTKSEKKPEMKFTDKRKSIYSFSAGEKNRLLLHNNHSGEDLSNLYIVDLKSEQWKGVKELSRGIGKGKITFLDTAFYESKMYVGAICETESKAEIYAFSFEPNNLGKLTPKCEQDINDYYKYKGKRYIRILPTCNEMYVAAINRITGIKGWFPQTDHSKIPVLGSKNSEIFGIFSDSRFWYYRKTLK